MDKKNIICYIAVIFLMIIGFTVMHFKQKNPVKTNTLTATVLEKSENKVTVQDSNSIIYTFGIEDMNVDIGSSILIEYTGLLNKNKQKQKGTIINYTTKVSEEDDEGIMPYWQDNGIFSKFYTLAREKVDKMTLDEKIGQIFLVRYPSSNKIAIEELKKYGFAGYTLYEKDFKGKTEDEVKDMLSSLQKEAKIPILTAVDEEGGKIVRISSNNLLAKEKFKSPSELYKLGGFPKIEEDVIEKSKVLNNLGLNLNLAPVVDVSTNSSDYMYDRTLQENTNLTSTYAETVIKTSKTTGVSYTLKHFPGYGNNKDTHTSATTDNRTFADIEKNDLPPFKAGIDVGAEAVLVSHNTVTNIDKDNPASLSPTIHNLLRNSLGFTGIIITDDLDMGAITKIQDPVIKAILAGNDLIITTDYEGSIKSVKNAINNGTVSEELIDKLAFRIIAWKYYKGLLFDAQK